MIMKMVDATTIPFENPASGFIGLGAYSADLATKNFNFMY
jgi:hypothetical protein